MKKSLLRLSGRDWLKQVIDPHITQVVSDAGTIPKIINGQEKFIFGLKCFQKDEYCGLNSSSRNIFYPYSPVYACKFGESEETCSLLGLAHEDGRIALQQTDGPKEGNYLIDKIVHENAIFDLAWIPKRKEFLTAVADSSVGLVAAEDLKIKVLFKGHTKSVKTVDSNAWDTNVCASGARDCNVIIWDIRCQPNNKANEIFGAHTLQKSFMNSPCNRSCASQIQNSVISVLFSQQYNLISAGASDGLIKVWDLRKTHSRGRREPQSLYVLEYAGSSSYRGYTSMQLSPYGERIYVSCLDGKIYAYHLVNPTLKPVAEFYGHKPNTYYAKFCRSPCGSYLLSGSSDDKAYIWLTKRPGFPVASLTGHLDEVTSVAWNSRNLGTLVTCSDDMKHRLFKYHPIEEKDFEDYEMKQNLLGCAIPYQINTSVQVSLTPNQLNNSTHKNLALACKFPSLGQLNTDNSNLKGFAGLSHSQASANSPVRSQLTPKQEQTRWKNGQVTPKTSGTKTLLSWLSTSKTPKERNHSPNVERSNSHRIVSKRKLSDFMEGSRENLQNEDRKPALSPSKNVLEDRQNMPVTTETSNCVAKTLYYKDSSGFQNTDGENTGSFQKISKSVSSQVAKSPCEPCSDDVSSPQSILLGNSVKTPPKTQVKDHQLLSSPTANLPNFVVDGRSPHNRREPPMTRRRQADWLTSLSQKRALMTATTIGVTRKRKGRLGSRKN